MRVKGKKVMIPFTNIDTPILCMQYQILNGYKRGFGVCIVRLLIYKRVLLHYTHFFTLKKGSNTMNLLPFIDWYLRKWRILLRFLMTDAKRRNRTRHNRLSPEKKMWSVGSKAGRLLLSVPAVLQQLGVRVLPSSKNGKIPKGNDSRWIASNLFCHRETAGRDGEGN